CQCKNNVSDPNNIPPDNGIKTNDIPPGTFFISEATDNVKASIIKSSTTSISDIKIGFVSANNYTYSFTYTVDDATETVEANKITADDFRVADNVLTAKNSVADKMKQVDSSTAPVEKTITINFTFTPDDKTLKNNTPTLSVEVKLTHAQSLNTTETKKSKVEEIFKLIKLYPGNNNAYQFDFSGATFTATDNNTKIEVKNSHAKANDNETITIEDFKTDLIEGRTYGLYEQTVQNLGYLSSVKFDDTQEQGKINGTVATFYVVLTFNPQYETEDIIVQIDVDAKNEGKGGKWADTTQTS
ncbi:hypothetical protein, partial [Brachyspira catarrhinii]|uniref:hypothetical protein n=1 Tax=Brachyspira catarrhinii TaxID=2528966 RepID=UPI001386D00A